MIVFILLINSTLIGRRTENNQHQKSADEHGSDADRKESKLSGAFLFHKLLLSIDDNDIWRNVFPKYVIGDVIVFRIDR